MFGVFRRKNPPEQSNVPVEVYGTKWCAATQMVRRYLERLGVPYNYHDMDADQNAANQVRWWTGGYTSHPTLKVGGSILVEPSTAELDHALFQQGMV